MLTVVLNPSMPKLAQAKLEGIEITDGQHPNLAPIKLTPAGVELLEVIIYGAETKTDLIWRKEMSAWHDGSNRGTAPVQQGFKLHAIRAWRQSGVSRGLLEAKIAVEGMIALMNADS